MIQLIRHGESLGNADPKIYNTIPDWAVPLSAKGVEQSRSLSNTLTRHSHSLGNQIIFVSPFIRTRQTLKYALETTPWLKDYTVIEDSRLREQDWGQSSRRDVEERTKFGTYFYRFKNGESVADVDDRVKSFLYEYRYEFLDQHSNFLFFAHGTTNRVLLKNFCNYSIEDLEKWRTQKNCGVWKISDGYLTNLGDGLEYYPDAGHSYWNQLKNEKT